MFFNDHNPPHFHAYYGSDEALFAIETLSLVAGRLPPRATGLVVEWASLHQAELMEAWKKGSGARASGQNRTASLTSCVTRVSPESALSREPSISTQNQCVSLILGE